MDKTNITIGIPKEGEPFPGIMERRVSLTPSGVREMIACGARVVVERDAGAGAGFADMEYEKSGAQIVYSHEEALGRANVILKISGFKLEEIEFIAPGTILMGFLSLAVVPEPVLRAIQNKKLTAISYETMENPLGTKPLLRISSEIAGKMSPQIAAQLLEAPGIGLLLGGIPGIPPADVVIIGAGVLGTYAALSFLGTGSSVYVLDKDREKLERLYNLAPVGGKMVTAMMTQESVEKFACFADVLISAVALSGEAAPLIVKKETVAKMRKGSVIIDFAIDLGGSIETTRAKGPQPAPYIEENIVHFSLPNVPSRVPRTSSHGLTYAILPYLQQIVAHGWPRALDLESVLRTGLCFFQGECVNEHLRGRCSAFSTSDNKA